MGIPVASIPCYLVEWYRYELTDETLERTVAALDDCAASMSAEGSPVQLLTVLAVPTDDVIFGVFTAGSAAVVAKTCDRAGMPARRLTGATEVQVPRPGGRKS